MYFLEERDSFKTQNEHFMQLNLKGMTVIIIIWWLNKELNTIVTMSPCVHGCSRDLLPHFAAEELWRGRTLMTSFAYWAPLPHAPRRPPIRSQRAADHARAATRVSRASAALYWRPERTEVSLSHTSAGFTHGGLFFVVLVRFMQVHLRRWC